MAPGCGGRRDDGDLMLAATDLLRAGPARIGSIGRLALPRAVRLRSVVSAAVGGVVGLLLGASVAALTGGTGPLVVGAALGALAGHVAMSVEPLPGESLATWLHLTASAHRPTGVGGRPARVVLVAEGAVPPGAVEVARAAGTVAVTLPAGLSRRDRAGVSEATVALGCCPLDHVPAGRVHILGGIVDVAPGSVDGRGRPVTRSGRGGRPPRR